MRNALLCIGVVVGTIGSFGSMAVAMILPMGRMGNLPICLALCVVASLFLNLAIRCNRASP